MESTNFHDKRIWRWWVVSDIISKSHNMIEIKSQKDDSGSVFSVAVHKELLCLCSPYYTAAIKGGFSESRQESFTVELDHRQTQMFVEWLYTGRCDSDPWQQINNHEVHALYVFADQTDIIAFRRSIMTCLVRGGRAPPTPSDMAKLVSQLPNDSGLRLSRGYVRKDFPEEFWDVLVYGQHGPYLPSCIACDYHEHTDEQEWKMTCATRFVPRRIPEPRPQRYKNASI